MFRILAASSVLLISTFAQSEVNNGFLREGVPTVVLQGEPHLVARRILRGPVRDTQSFIQRREPTWVADGGRQPVNVVYADGNVRGQQVMVYRHVLRPARLIFHEGQEKIIHQWVHNEDIGNAQVAPDNSAQGASAQQPEVQVTFARQPIAPAANDMAPAANPDQFMHGGEVRTDAQWIAQADNLEREKLMRQHWFDDLKQ